MTLTTIQKLFLDSVKENASDLFIHAGRKPTFRKQGVLHPGNGITSREDIEKFRKEILSGDEENLYLEKHSSDTSCTIGIHRFRINFFETFHGPALAVRPIRSGNDIDFASRNLPEEFLIDLCKEKRGLILICGSTGSGKSTTMAAMLNYINKNFCRHILTLEDPVEYIFEDEQSRFSQRETGSQEGAFSEALRSALRENPDVIAVGEMRDLESMQTAVNAAMTGHLVLATVHTSDTIRAVERIVSMFPENVREQASCDIAQSLNAVIAQRLIPAKNEKELHPALELLPATPTVKKLIAERDFAGLEDLLKRGVNSGMQSFTRAIFNLYKEGKIALEKALENTDNPDELQLLIKGMENGTEIFHANYGYDSKDGNFVDMKTLLCYAHRFKASDLHLSAYSRPILRLNGTLRSLDLPELSPQDIQRLLFSVLTRSQRITLEEKKELDLAISVRLDNGLPPVRYRLNCFYQKGSPGAVARVVNSHIPTPEELTLPPQFVDLINKQQGLILVTGPTGSGKSTTLASLIDEINRTTRRHIITIEDPIEYIHNNKKSIVEQRELFSDTLSFATALKFALRQDPDVIMVGEMRDTETIAAALTAAETGHLVFATIHTNSAPQTIDRIIDSFPAEQQNQIKLQLAGVLLSVISQRLLPRLDGKGRAAAFEILMGTPPVQALIRDNKTFLLQSCMETSAKDGMQTLEKSLKDLYERGLISYESTKLFHIESNIHGEF